MTTSERFSSVDDEQSHSGAPAGPSPFAGEVSPYQPSALGLGLCDADIIFPPKERAALDRDLADIARQRNRRDEGFYTDLITAS